MLFLISGLGNPGKKYESTRHNVGFRALNRLAEDHNIAWSRSKFSAHSGSGTISGQRVLLLKPQTFMNLSGNAVSAAAHFYRIPTENIAVVHDDIDLSIGRIQARQGGGHGGHRGLRSIQESIGSREFVRFRMGVGRPDQDETSDYVLDCFSKKDQPLVEDLIERTGKAVALWLQSGLVTTMNQFNPWIPDAEQ